MKKITFLLLLLAAIIMASCTEEIVHPKSQPGVTTTSQGQF